MPVKTSGFRGGRGIIFFSGGGQKRIVTKLSNILFVQIHRIQIFVQIVLQYRFKISKRI